MVRLGTPVAIGIRSQLLGRRLGAHDGCGSLPSGKIELMLLPADHAAFDIDLVKFTGWADIGLNLLCGFAQRRECRKLRQHGKPAEKWLVYSTFVVNPRQRNLLLRYRLWLIQGHHAATSGFLAF
jgi:hypothetical protein